MLLNLGCGIPPPRLPVPFFVLRPPRSPGQITGCSVTLIVLMLILCVPIRHGLTHQHVVVSKPLRRIRPCSGRQPLVTLVCPTALLSRAGLTPNLALFDPSVTGHLDHWSLMNEAGMGAGISGGASDRVLVQEAKLVSEKK